MHIISYFVFILIFCSSVTYAVDNPVSYDSSIHDCDALKYNGEYYLTGNWLGGDMLRSRNLLDWGERKHVFSWNNSWHTPNHDPQDLDIHAGHLRYHNGYFHLYTQLEPKQGVSETYSITHAVSSNVWGPYTEAADEPFAVNIDAETFLDDDGEFYFHATYFDGGNKNHVCRMTDLWNLVERQECAWWGGNCKWVPDYIHQISGTSGWEDNTHINEGPKIIKYRDRYYMLYAAFATTDPRYSIGCVEASTPTGFSNAGKYSLPVCTRITPPGFEEIAYLGQPWVVDGLNGFEKWMGYFAQTASEGRTQRIDRMHFFDRKLFVDGPTNRYTEGYHPGPAEPQLRSLFYIPDGPMPADDWNLVSADGVWEVLDNEAYQSSQNCFSFNLVNRKAAAHYLIEANVKMTAAQDGEDKTGVVAYFEDWDNWVIVGLDRSLNYGGDNWYCHVRENAVDTIYHGPYNGSMNYSVYHKIRVTKNGGNFDIRIDDIIPPNHTTIVTGFAGAGVPGIYSNHAPAVYDGIIYTIGWDEYDSSITGWGSNIGGFAQAGNWSTGADGIAMAAGTGYTFKGDLMNEYEVAAQVYKQGTANGGMGLIPVAINAENYLLAYIDTSTNELVATGVKNSAGLSEQRIGVEDKDDYNIRAVKLSDRVILFVDGIEKMTYTGSFPPSQVGLYAGNTVNNMEARFNGIMAYELGCDELPGQWTNTDIGPVGFEGSASYNEGTFTVNGSGQDIWGLDDDFHYVYEDLRGDGEIVARLVSDDITDWWSKAGIMFRNGLAEDAGMVMLAHCGGGSLQLIWRDGPGMGTAIYPDVNIGQSEIFVDLPVWLRLIKNGAAYYAYYSEDGSNWNYLTYCMPFDMQNVKAGLCVCARNNTRIHNGVFDNVSITGCTPGNIEMDLDRDCEINIDDLVIFVQQWLGETPLEGNFDGTGSVNLMDFSLFAEHWLTTYDD